MSNFTAILLRPGIADKLQAGRKSVAPMMSAPGRSPIMVFDGHGPEIGPRPMVGLPCRQHYTDLTYGRWAHQVGLGLFALPFSARRSYRSNLDFPALLQKKPAQGIPTLELWSHAAHFRCHFETLALLREPRCCTRPYLRRARGRLRSTPRPTAALCRQATPEQLRMLLEWEHRSRQEIQLRGLVRISSLVGLFSTGISM